MKSGELRRMRNPARMAGNGEATRRRIMPPLYVGCISKVFVLLTRVAQISPQSSQRARSLRKNPLCVLGGKSVSCVRQANSRLTDDSDAALRQHVKRSRRLRAGFKHEIRHDITVGKGRFENRAYAIFPF